MIKSEKLLKRTINSAVAWAKGMAEKQTIDREFKVWYDVKMNSYREGMEGGSNDVEVGTFSKDMEPVAIDMERILQDIRNKG